MKTLKTNRGIEYDLIIEDFHNGPVYTEFSVNVISTEGEKEFTLNVKNYGRPFYNYEFDEVAFDLSEVEKWVDSVTIGEISRLAAEVCINKSNGNYWSFSIYTLDTIRVSILEHMSDSSVKGKSATGYGEIIFLLNNLKNG